MITAERAEPAAEPAQLELSCRTGANGYQIVSVTGELDIATAEQAYSYLSEVIDGRPAPVTVDLSGLTFCDASGLGVLARSARYARRNGRQLALASARPSLLRIMRITGLDRAFPELHPVAHAYSALATGPAGADRGWLRPIGGRLGPIGGRLGPIGAGHWSCRDRTMLVTMEDPGCPR